MTRRLAAALVFWAAAAQAQDLEWIPLFISNRGGGAPALSAGDLRVSCDGKAGAAVVLKPDREPVSVAIVVQGSRDMARNLVETQRALRSFLRHAQPGDEFFTVKGLEQPALGTGFTSDVDAIVSSIAMPDGTKRPMLFDAVEFALRYLKHARHSDRAVLVLMANEDVASTVKVKAMAPRVLAQHIPVYVASMYRRYANDLAPTFFEMLRLAEQSGGDMWEVYRFSDLDTTLAGVNFHPQYLLGIPPALCSRDQQHALHVDWAGGFAHPGVTLRYQRQLIEGAGVAAARRVSEASSH